MMPFDEAAIFPPAGLMYDFDASGGPGMDTTIIDKDSGYATAFAHFGPGRRRYENVQFTVHTPAKLAILKAFFWCRSGTAMGFRFLDVNDFSSAPDGISPPTALDQPVILDGDGNYRLVKQYAGGAINRYIFKPISSGVVVPGAVTGVGDLTPTVIFADGGTIVTATINQTTGVVTGYTPSSTFTAGFYFHTPARFDGPFKLSMDDYNIGSAMSLTLRELIYPLNPGTGGTGGTSS